MPVTDSMFLLAESREHPMHVGGLQLFELPDGAGPDYVNEFHRQLLSLVDLRPLFRQRPRGPVGSVGQFAWTNDEQLDLEYHVRLSGLPRPGRVRELLELTSRLHGYLLDRHRPLWEFTVMDGLQGNRFATYTKVHHALLDGVAALRLLQDSLSEDPNDMTVRPPWSPKVRTDVFGGGSRRSSEGFDPVRAVTDFAKELRGFGAAAAKVVNEAFREQSATLSFQAPRSMFNVPITGARRFAAQGWPLDRIKAVGKAAGATMNDVMLAMCAGALRRYMLDLGTLPDKPLVAAIPMSLRARAGGMSEHSLGGNAIGIILCDLATTLPDAGDRLRAIHESMLKGKQVYHGMSRLQITALSALPLIPLAIGTIPGMTRITPPAFNVLISNVPGPRSPLYW
ncbi:MAG: wax ester/triacylglycerol synthase family O-acyltransferase, partial [Pseudonocardiaceae bacterium]|nr:wax ester/triacylglycerol synthase family O-acyltransferase [Pseudonocardiaceae bacterium]